MVLQRALDGWGHEVVEVRDGAQAWEVLQDPGAPKMVILDWMMPGLDGVDVCRRVRGLDTTEPPYVIMLTAMDDKEDLVAALNAGADDFVNKPFDPAELHARLEVGRRILELNERLAEARCALERLANTDELTEAMNRRAILQRLEEEAARASRGVSDLSVAMIDIDHFKRVNDTYGHGIGDVVLREVVCRSASAMRPYDAIGRFGGEEFLAVMPGTGELEALSMLKRIRAAVAASPIAFDGGEVAVTVSLGGATSCGESLDALIARADEALYRAKEQGRDRALMARAPAPLVKLVAV